MGADQTAVAEARRRHPTLRIAGWRHGYYARDKELDVVAAINASGADCLFIGMPTPHKERFLARHRHMLDTSFVMGVGGGIDVLAGHVKRAPRWMRNNGLEWLYRVLQEPRRMWKRYLTTNAVFAFLMAKALIVHQRPT
jgi:N-acetylglucosaminyldiphosphoundecaprenol N-acetyl-beta-D-mannosaminyltransferase